MREVEEALITALKYENRVRDEFRRFSEQSDDPNAKMFFEVMARDEQEHVDYLESRLAEWRDKGKISEAELTTAVPQREWLRNELEQAGEASEPARRQAPSEYLLKALRREEEVSEVYRKLAESVDDPAARAVFRRFLEIEDDHTAVVQAQIEFEALTGDYLDLTAY